MTLEIAASVIEAIKIIKKAQTEVASCQAVWNKVYNAQSHLDKEIKQFLNGE